MHWFNSFYPDLADGLSDEERHWIDRLNRVGMVYFRPLVMAILKNESNESNRIRIFKRIERFIFLTFRVNAERANYGSSEFYNAARALDRGEITLEEIANNLDGKLAYSINEDGSFRFDTFRNLLFKKFDGGSGYYGWSGLRYFLYEYELGLLSESRQKKVDWSDLLKAEGDKISIEHIYPQTETDEWSPLFIGIEPDHRPHYGGTVGNLLLLSMWINSSLQNDSFEAKKKVKLDLAGKKIRNGYADGSHSEIEVSQIASWGPDQIRERGIKLLRFMEQRWDFKFKNDD
ncbi:MAG TPA: HNH endonuclease family protein [Verrucomicrobiae bacterium]